MNKIPFQTGLGLELFRAFRSAQTKLHELNYLFWECTLRCNLNCSHCGSDCTKSSSVKDMPIADFLKAVDSVRPHVDPHNTTIVITGGEPILRNDLEECGIELYKREFPWGIVSNGFALDAVRLDSLRSAGLRSITISLDGLEKSHDIFRGEKGSYVRALKAIELCAKCNDLEFDVVTCVHQNNLSELDELKKILVTTCLKRWRLFTIFPKGRAAQNDHLKLSSDQFVRLMDFIVSCREEGIISASYGCEGFLGPYEGKARDSFFFCKAGVSVGSVLIDGSISACPSLRSDYIQGNIYADDFWEVWENRFTNMRDRSWTKSGKCATCKQFKYCNGNGLHLREEKSGELLFCQYELINEKN